ncbi:MAG: tetratricopeptide repeat protein [Thermoguttaceae bacterium]
MLNVRVLVGTFAVLVILAVAAYFWLGYQARRTASAFIDRAEALAEEKHFAAAAGYYSRYLELYPEDGDARLRRAELFEQSAGGRGGLTRVIELYQEALRPARQGLAPEKQLMARRRLMKFLLEANEFAAAESEVEKLRELEQNELAEKPQQWQWPGLKALALAGKFHVHNSAVPSATLEEAFGEVLDPERAGKPKVYQDPEVYLARYEYRLQQKLPNANEDLDAALKLAPANSAVLLTAAAAAQREAAAAAQAGSREKTRESCSRAYGYYERAIVAAPSDRRAYEGLGQLYGSLGDLDRAIQTWRRGLREVRSKGECIPLNLNLAEALIRQGRTAEAESVLKTLDGDLAELDPKAKLSLQRLVDLRRAKLLCLRGRYDEAIPLVADLAAGKEVVQGGAGLTTPHVIYEAWMVLGESHAALKQCDPALAAYEQAALLEPREATPRLAAAAACKAAGRRDAAIASYQQALAIINAQKPPPAGQQQAIYEQLIALLEEQKRSTEADRYRVLRKEQMAESARLTLEGVGQALRDGKLAEALAVAQRGVQSRPQDPWAYVSLGRAQRASQDNAQADRAYRKAVEAAKDQPQVQMAVAEFLLASSDRDDHAAAENVLRGLLTRHAPACLRLTGLLAARGKPEEAMEVARQGVQSQPKDALAQIALGLASWANKDNAHAEAAFQEASRLAPDDLRPLSSLFDFYADTGQTKRARETIEKVAQNTALKEIDRALLLAEGYGRLGDRPRAGDAYRKAVKAAKDDPTVEMRLAEFLLRGKEHDEAAEGERMLRELAKQYGPARRRLAELLLARGGEQDREEADKYLKQLEQLAPEDLGTLELRARWLRDQGRAAEIEPLVEPAAEKLRKRIGNESPRQEAPFCQAVGGLYERIGEYSAAERWYRRLVRLAPDGYEPLAMALAKQGRTREAVALCDEAGKTDKSARPARRLASILLSGRATAEDLKRAEPSLEKALANYKDDLPLLANVANVRILQGHPDEAIALYRQILQRQPSSPEMLNNLATLLAERPEPEKRQEALEHVEQAIQLSGPQPDWLDTKGLILMYEGKLDEAVGLLKEAAGTPHPDPRFSFHLAVAYARRGDLDKARAALQQARRGDLDHQFLTAMDRQLLADLEKKLGL